MSTVRFARGAVVRCHNRAWIVWDYGDGHGCYDVLPVRAQTGPLHRSQLRLTVQGKAMVAHLLSSTLILPDDCQFIEQCDLATVSELEARRQRAVDADAFESRHSRFVGWPRMI